MSELASYFNDKHLAFIIPGYPPENHSWGIGTYAKQIVDAFQKQGVAITVISRSSEKKKRVEKADNLTIIRVPSPDLSASSLDLTSWTYRLREEWEDVHARKSINLTESADWGGEANIFLTKDTPDNFVVRVHSPGFLVEKYNPKNPSYLSEATKKMEMETIGRAGHVIVNSEGMMGSLRPYLNSKAQTFVAPYVCPTHEFSLLPKDDVVRHVVSVGRLEERKGPDILVHALELLGKTSPIDATFVGMDTPIGNNQSFKDRMLSHTSGWLKKRLHFTGAVSHSDALKRIRGSHCSVQPARFENFAFAMLEPMSLGRPVVLPSLSTLDNMRYPFAPFTFQANNAASLAKSLEALCKMKHNDLQNLAKGYYDFFTGKFAEKAALNENMRIFKEIMESKKPSAYPYNQHQEEFKL